MCTRGQVAVIRSGQYLRHRLLMEMPVRSRCGAAGCLQPDQTAGVMGMTESDNVENMQAARLRLCLRVNGAGIEVSAAPGTCLLDILRNRLGLTGAKEACGRGECGACTVLLDGRPVVSCLVFAEMVEEAVTTVEGLAQECADLRQSFADCGAFQCGFCTPGQIVRASALLREKWPDDSAEHEAFVRHRMSGNICRCTGYTGIVQAILRTAAVRRAVLGKADAI
jgi:aerobic-type carbon monoxide dehydrogenase small subunit (CoxS/CutS family)